MGDFSTAFNTMTRQLKDSYQELERRNQFIRKTFGRYTSDEVVEALLDVPDGLKLGGEEREVTILMSDLRGFTAMAARLTPQEVIGCLNLYLESMVEVITRYQGTIDEIIGDAILVLFGAPMPCEQHASKAVACGLAMQLAMPDVNRRLLGQGAPDLAMGIGIHTGRVIVGNIGSLRRSKYAAVGSNVNLAGRIESFTTGGQLLISENTREAIKTPLRTIGQFQVEPKGATRSLQLYEVGGIGEPFNLSLPSNPRPCVRCSRRYPSGSPCWRRNSSGDRFMPGGWRRCRNPRPASNPSCRSRLSATSSSNSSPWGSESGR